MNKRIKRPLLHTIIVIGLAILFAFLYCLFERISMLKAFFALPYWQLIIVGIALFLVTPFVNESVNLSPRSKLEKMKLREKRIKRRHTVMCFVIMAVILYLNFMDPEYESVFGKNGFGVSELVMTIIVIAAACLLIYMGVISDRDYKVSFKDASVDAGDDLEVIELYQGSYEELKFKMKSQYNLWGILNKIAIDTHKEMFTVNNYNYIDAIQKLVELYLKDDDDIEDFNVFLFRELKSRKYSDYETMVPKLEDGVSCTPNDFEKQLLIPFKSLFGDNFIISLDCRHQPINLDHYLILGILCVFEQMVALHSEFEDTKKLLNDKINELQSGLAE